MAGIYLHIPFCRQACHYCNFHFSTSLRYKNEFVEALLKEIDLFYTDGDRNVETIYFGGGTPSLMANEDIKKILDKVRSKFTVSPGTEITLEANPDDITEDKLIAWKEAGINRLSIGIQSFFEEDLQWMNRAHNAQQAIDSLQMALKHFSNITIDLIYGTPQLTNEKWKQNVEKALSLSIPHLSCYALTVEPKTPLDKMIRQQQSPNIDTNKQSEQFLLLMQWMEEAGYEHYEISNFAKPGFRSRHNSSYWQGKNYYGFGPSAHSFDGNTRWWNIANNNTYIQSINNNTIPLEKEELTNTQKMNEYIMISLRTIEGMDMNRLPKDVIEKSKKFAERGLLTITGNSIILTKEGRLLADGIASDLFID